ncbi:MAG TPA: hypothetical protein VFS21_37180 [Roseiflexaceae bacterium]|nr:hypothetical protein [Roseiflexaceae bacterium]
MTQTPKKLAGVWRERRRPWQRRRAQMLPREVMVVDEPPRAQICVYDSVVILTRRDPRGFYRSHPIDPAQLAQVLGQLPVSTGLLPSGTLATGMRDGKQFYVQYIAPRAVRLPVVTLGERRMCEIQTPPLVWAGCGKDYRIWALRTAEVLRTADLLCVAPFPNTYESGRICWGSAKILEASASTMPEQLKIFLEGSDFNLHMVGGKSAAYSANIVERYADLSAETPYPLDDLVNAGRRTLGDALNGTWG